MSKPPADRTWQDAARSIESLGYSSLLLADHFGDQLAPVPAMAAAAEATTTLRVGALVLDNDYKHPVVLAKEMATVDVLSGGRVEFGIGAGWMRTDYEESGIAYDSPKVRVDRFEEALAIYRGLFGGEPVNHTGEHYTITNLSGRPLPISPGGPPLLIGAGGKRMLSIAARWADIISVNPNMVAGVADADTAKDAMAASIDEKIGWIRAAAGDRLDEIELSTTLFFVSVTNDGDSMAEGVGSMFGVSGADVREAPIIAIGTVAEIADALRARRERWGFSYVLVNADSYEAFAPVVAELAGT